MFFCLFINITLVFVIFLVPCYSSIHLKNSISDIRGDIRDRKLLREIVQNFQPEIVFHLAAQPIVLNSYEIPVDTFDTNVTGTVNLLNELRQINSVKTIIVMTSDKSYRNNEWVYPYRENDELGGKDPYSASKSCQDIVVDSFRESYFSDSGVDAYICKINRVYKVFLNDILLILHIKTCHHSCTVYYYVRFYRE